MAVAVDDIVPLTIFRVEAYGLWGTHDGQTGSVHVSDFTDAPPIDEDRIPRVGDTVPVRVFNVTPRTEVEYAWGRLVCDFAASLVLTKRPAEPIAAPDPALKAGPGR
ncbi:MAG: hypothetical protein KF873_23265 [Gemmataceae bacterium]|nr:hypothetical protein [Gemmataceae bacterium]